ncbi:hypothetical protein C6P40_001228 [Pichia californica]|uniref:Uncharacterized protein n=1 Tax=Pichia californica TaxID=460514 RepID=A0A9P6WPH6_9ASCO|nr:hypothetical protein C6P42_004415 [[Candida] californica]KAG0690794.1 hypothetical protein C6P40_001228 [[Candida] californica]
MQPFVHEAGNKHAVELAKKAEQTGLTTMFNNDPKVSVETFTFYKKYSFFHPDLNDDDANAFATLVRECVHFEVETVSSMLTFGLDLNLVFPQVTVSYMFRSCRASLKDRYKDKGVDDQIAEAFARDLVENVYNFIKPKMDLPDMKWQGASANLL